MGDVSSKEQRIRCSIQTGGTNYQDSGRQQPPPQPSLITPLWFQFMLAPTTTKTTSCDTAPLPPPPPPPGGTVSPSPPPPPPGSPAISAPPPLPTPEEERIAAAVEAVSSVPNPGPYEHTTNDVRRMLNLDTHDGFRCEINKGFNPFFVVAHSFWLGTSMIPDGRNNSYAGVIQIQNDNCMLFSRVDPFRPSVDFRLMSPVLPVRLQVSVSGEGNDQAVAEVDFGQQTWMANLKYGSMGNGLMWGCNFYQSITPRLAVGGEGMFLAVNNSFLSTYMVKYTIPARTGEEDWSYQPAIPGGLPTTTPTTSTSSELKGSSTIWANLNLAQSLLTLSYLRVVTPQRVTLAAELQCNPLTLDSQVSLGAEFKFLRQKFSTSIDGSGRIQSIVETKLDKAPGSPTLNFSAEMDHGKELTRFGYGMAFEG